MGVVFARLRPQFRRRWLPWLLVAALVGVAGGVVTSIVAGGARTQSSYERFLDQAAPSDVCVLDSSDYGFSGRIDLDQVRELDSVAEVAEAYPLFLVSGEAGGQPITYADLLPMMTTDGRLGTEIDRQTVIEGRAADPDDPHEAVVGVEAMDRLGLEVGSTVRLDLLAEEDFFPLSARYLDGIEERIAGDDPRSSVDVALAPEGGLQLHPVEVEIVGIVMAPGALPPLPGNNQPYLHLTPAFARELAPGMTKQLGLFVRLEPDASIAEFKRGVEAIAGNVNVSYSYTRVEQSEAVDDTLRLQALALWALAGLVGASAALILGQLVVRQARAEAVDDPRLRAVGITSLQLFAVDAVRVGGQALVAGLVAAGIGLLVAPVWLFGSADIAEVERGAVVDPGIHVLGAGLTAAFLIAVGLGAGWAISRSARARVSTRARAATRRRPAFASGLLPRPLAFGLGARQALDAGRGERSVPVRSAVFGVGVGIAAVVVAATFAASLDGVLDTPASYGWNWDVQVGTVGSPDVHEQLVDGMLQNEGIAGISAGTVVQIQFGGVRTDAYALRDLQGGAPPRILEGRPAEAADEIVVGTVTLREADAEVGDELYVGVGQQAARMTVVGRAVFPSFADQGQLGVGARVTLGGLRRLAALGADEDPVQNVFLVRYRDGVDGAALSEQLDRALNPYLVAGPRPPEDLDNLADADRVPLLAGATLALLAVGTLAHALLTAARRRQREMGALRSMGFERRQVLETFAGQAAVLSLGALLVGVPLGVVVGRWAWIQVAEAYGFPAEPVVPVALIVALVVVVPLIALLVALGPGWMAARARTADILRSE